MDMYIETDKDTDTDMDMYIETNKDTDTDMDMYIETDKDNDTDTDMDIDMDRDTARAWTRTHTLDMDMICIYTVYLDRNVSTSVLCIYVERMSTRWNVAKAFVTRSNTLRARERPFFCDLSFLLNF
jgi:hypothetical protein